MNGTHWLSGVILMGASVPMAAGLSLAKDDEAAIVASPSAGWLSKARGGERGRVRLRQQGDSVVWLIDEGSPSAAGDSAVWLMEEGEVPGGCGGGDSALWLSDDDRDAERDDDREAFFSDEAGPDEVGPDEVGLDDVGPDEAGPDDVGPDDVGPDAVDVPAPSPAEDADEAEGRRERPRARRTRDLRSARAPADRSPRSDRGDRPDRRDRSDRSDRADRADRADRSDRADRADASEAGDDWEVHLSLREGDRELELDIDLDGESAPELGFPASRRAQPELAGFRPAVLPPLDTGDSRLDSLIAEMRALRAEVENLRSTLRQRRQ